MNYFVEQTYLLNSSLGGNGGTGLKISNFTDLNSNAQIVFNTPPGGICGWNIANTGADNTYVKFYNNSSPIGGDVPVITLAIPPGFISDLFFSRVKEFSNGCYIRATQGVADDNNDDPTTNQVVGAVFYVGELNE